MDIHVLRLNRVYPNFRGGGNPCNLILDVTLEEQNAERLFYDLWSKYEGHTFQRWIEAEGYKLVKKESL